MNAARSAVHVLGMTLLLASLLPVGAAKAEPAEDQTPPVRVQEPQPPLPYEVLELTYTAPDGVTLAGTLTLPRGDRPVPAVYLIPGASPFDRDQSIVGHRPFLVWADRLTRAGFAVLRVDDRGVGGSGGDKSLVGYDGLVRDVRAGLRVLAARPEVDADRVGLLGHSQGAALAPLVASADSSVAFVVLLAGAGESFIELMARGHADDPAALPVLLKAASAASASIRTANASEGEIESVREKVAEAVAGFPADERDLALAFFKDIEGRLRAFLPKATLRDMLAYSPTAGLEGVRCPALFIGGGLDRDLCASLPMVVRALEASPCSDYRVQKMAGMNHLLQKADNNPPAWQANETTVSPLVLDAVESWLLAVGKGAE